MESTPSQTAEGMALVRVLAQVLDRLVASNAPVVKTIPLQVTKFHALKAPAISILQYLERIHKYASCSTECFVFALIYIDRLIQRNNFILTELNIHRVVITAVLLSAKFYDDSYYNNAYYAKVGGVPVTEMNGLELEFLFFVQFSLHVTPDVFARYRYELMSHSGWTGLEQPLLIPSQVILQQYPQTAIASTSIIYDYSFPVSNPVATMMQSTEKSHSVMQGIASHAWTQQQGTAHASQITPSPPPSATSVSPTSCDEHDKTEQMLYIDNLKYYSAPCRNNSYLLPGTLNLSRHRSNSLPFATDHGVTLQYFNSSTSMDSIVTQQPKFFPMEPYTRVISQDRLVAVPGMTHVHSSIPMMDSNSYKTISRSRPEMMVRTSSHERCLSIPISPNASSPRFMDTIVSSKS